MLAPDLLWLQNDPVAHRGLHNGSDVPENSLAAFEQAASAGIPIELDVQRTVDGQVVVFHDYSTKRMTGKDISITTSSWEEISAERLSGTAHRIPLLREVFALVSRRVGILIELKNEGAVGSLEPSVAELIDAYDGRVAVQAFNPFVLSWFARNRPALHRGQLAGDFSDRRDIGGFRKYLLKNMYMNFLSRPSFISYDIRAGDVAYFRRMRRRFPGKPILLWLVDTQSKRQMCEQLGVNYIFENLPPA